MRRSKARQEEGLVRMAIKRPTCDKCGKRHRNHGDPPGWTVPCIQTADGSAYFPWLCENCTKELETWLKAASGE